MNVDLSSTTRHKTGNDRKVVCEFLDAALQPYVMTERQCDGTVLCIIDNLTECQSAASYVTSLTPKLQPEVDGIDTDNYKLVDSDNVVAGCSTNKNYRLVFNTNMESTADNKVHSDRTVICQRCPSSN